MMVILSILAAILYLLTGFTISCIFINLSRKKDILLKDKFYRDEIILKISFIWPLFIIFILCILIFEVLFKPIYTYFLKGL